MKIKEILKLNRFNMMLLILAFNYWLAHIGMLPQGRAVNAFEDTGFMSHLTVVALMVAQFIFLWFIFKSEHIKDFFKNFSIAYVIQIYFMREADFHIIMVNGKRQSMTNVKYYMNSDISIFLKILSLTILTLLALAIAYLILFYGKKFLTAFFNKEPWTIAFLLWGVLLFLSQVCDRWGVINKSPYWQIKTIEEMLEFTSALFLASCGLQYLLEYKRTKIK